MKNSYCEKFGSFERFNRVLYGGHANDTLQERFFTFAGDTPIFMGASSDYTKDTWCYQAKNGILMSGLALTPGHVEGNSRDIFSLWLHNSPDILSKWHHGYMTYELSGISAYFPDVKINMAVYPLNPHDGYVVHYDISTNQRVIFCAGFGGITPFFGRFEYHHSCQRDFSIEDCKDTVAKLYSDSGEISGANAVTMRIAANFECEYSLDAATALTEAHPSMFLTNHPGLPQIIKIRRNLQANEHFSGDIIVMRNGSREEMRNYLQMPGLNKFLRNQIRAKYASINFKTPDSLLDHTVYDTIIAQDASFHGCSFYHGAIGYHAPFLGWRGWYAPVLLGWCERVKTAIKSHFDTITQSNGHERVWWDGSDRPDLDHEGTQYHHIENSSGHLTALLHRDDIYNMQEVAVDMTLYYLEYSGDLITGGEIYDRLCEILDWEERILDPDGDGLYQNFLNTWISDGHCYNGAGCAQASSYNYAFNLRVAELGRKLAKDVSKLEARAEKIQNAFQNQLWQELSGVVAESVDTIGNKLLHGTPELSTIYLAADCGNIDFTQSWRSLKWIERNIKSVKTAGRGGKLYFSSPWLPKKYSTCGIFPAENSCLALTYFQNGQGKKAMEIINGLTDGFLLSPHPGSLTHIFTASGGSDSGDIDFTDVSSCYLRLLFEGLWGIKRNLFNGITLLAPQLPDDWPIASLSLPGIKLNLSRKEMSDNLIYSSETGVKVRLPMRYGEIEQVFVNGLPVKYQIVPGIETSFVEIITDDKIGSVDVFYCNTPYPKLKNNKIQSFSGNLETISVIDGSLERILDFSSIFTKEGEYYRLNALPGVYDLLISAKTADTEVLLPLEVEVADTTLPSPPLVWNAQNMVDISKFFNGELSTIHQQNFYSPRPPDYSIGMRLNGRYAWEWNHYGHNALRVDDSRLRNCGGVFRTPAGISFLTPAEGKNCATVSIWDNFPTKLEIPVSGSSNALALLLSGTTHAMQSHVVNGKITVKYSDENSEIIELIPPFNFDDFLIPAYQSSNETIYFSEGTHGMVQIIRLDPQKELAALEIEAIANETIINLLAITKLNV